MKEFEFMYLRNVKRNHGGKAIGTTINYGVIGEDNNVRTFNCYKFSFKPNQVLLIPKSSLKKEFGPDGQSEYVWKGLQYTRNHFEVVRKSVNVDDAAFLLAKLMNVFKEIRGVEGDIFPSSVWKAFDLFGGKSKGLKSWFKREGLRLMKEKNFDIGLAEESMSEEKKAKEASLKEDVIALVKGKKVKNPLTKKEGGSDENDKVKK